VHYLDMVPNKASRKALRNRAEAQFKQLQSANTPLDMQLVERNKTERLRALRLAAVGPRGTTQRRT